MFMETNSVYIKNMVCRRCVMTVTDVFKENGVTPLKVELGAVTVEGSLSPERMEAIRRRLEEYGFEVIGDKRTRLMEQIRVGVIEFVREVGLQERMNLSEYLQGKCHREYSALSKLFTEMKGVRIEKYYVAQRVELVKELLAYGELTVGEIADRLHYSSAAHLSAQFKAMTGLSPTQFRRLREPRLKPLDEI